MSRPRSTAQRANAYLAGALAVLIIGMAGLSFAAVPLYRLFCAVTGYAGTPDTRAIAAPGATGRTVTVRFNADTSPSLPWEFTPGVTEKRVTLGEDNLAWYEGRNLAQVAVTAMATYNVTPEKVGKYFHKTACFCFNEQTLAPGQDMRFPLSYWVDPAIATDPDTRDVSTITLSYTFFRSLDDAARNGGLDRAGPHVGPYAGPRAELSGARASR